MTLSSGTRLGPYEITGTLGAGGMGEVYRARDTRLERSVAIKVLPAELAQNAQFRSRFEREAKAISSLNHPNICTLHDIGHDNGIDYLVLELVEGESLADRIARGSLPMADVLRYGSQIAEGLDRAHRAGIVHRDLKPGNVMITKSGAKLLDFGLAKSAVTVLSPESATIQKALTAEGTIVGTFQYMSPEQLEGVEADPRTDIFALGAVLYEMATGRRAFEGKTRPSLMAAIVSSQPPPISQIQPLTPLAFEHVVERCMHKDPADRWQSAHDIAEELKWISGAGAESRSQAGIASAVRSRRRNRERLWLAVAIAVSIAAVALAGLLWRATSVPPRSLHASIVPPAGVTIDAFGPNAASLTLSPDGRYLTFAAHEPANDTRLWITGLDSGETKPILGTDHGFGPFWSPDSRNVAFFADGKLKIVDVRGGPAVPIADAPDGRGGTWSREGVILFEPFWRAPIYRVAAVGGPSTPLTKLNAAAGETTHRWPVFLPDGNHFLYLAASHRGTQDQLNAIYVGSLESPERRLLLRARSNLALAGKSLLFVRDQYLLAQEIDLEKIALIGEPVRIAEGVAEESGFFRAVFAAANDGTLVYLTGSTALKTRLVSFDRAGHGTDLVQTDSLWAVRIAPDGKSVAVAAGDPADIWIYDLAHGGRTRFTSDPMSDSAGTWSPDGKELVFNSDRDLLGASLYRKPIDRLVDEAPFAALKDQILVPGAWSPDGRFIAVTSFEAKNPNATGDVWIVPMTGDAKPFPFIATSFLDTDPRFSPDGKWLAFISNETGKNELYAVRFPERTDRRQLSNGGVSLMRSANVAWPAKGHAIFYVGADRTLMSTDYANGQFGEPKPLFKFDTVPFGVDSFDGEHFLAAIPEARDATAITLVANWERGLKR